MVVSKDGKRKRKESPIVDTSPEVPKRTKVQAQRKFAQGQGNPSASYSISSAIAASSSQPNTPARDNNKDSIPELIPHKKPSAEDLVTYICFRGTPGLPPHLDFFNQNKKTSEKDEKEAKEANQDSKPSPSPTKEAAKKGGKKEKSEKSNDKGETDDKNAASGEKATVNDKKAEKSSEKLETMGFAARKRADQVVEGNRKFRNNERLTRLRERTPKTNTGNRRSPRTRSAKVESDDDDDDDDEHVEEIVAIQEEPEQDKVSEKSEPPKKTTPSKKPAKGKRKMATTPIKEPSLERESQSTPVSNLRIKRGQPKQLEITPEKPAPPEKRSESVSKKSDVSSKISSKGGKKTPVKRNLKTKDKAPSADEEDAATETSPPKPKRGKKATVAAAAVEADVAKKAPETSQRSENNTPECETRTGRPMRKTKEAATIYMELIGLKLTLDDFDDDGSMASFPDLPNAKETQKMENELKQNALKEKTAPSKSAKKAATVAAATNKTKGGAAAAAKKAESEAKIALAAKKTESETKVTTTAAEKKVVEAEMKAIVVQEKAKPTAAAAKVEPARKDVNKNEKAQDLEKSFNDSDDEPLVTQKIEQEIIKEVATKTKPKAAKVTKKKPAKTSSKVPPAKKKVVAQKKAAEDKPALVKVDHHQPPFESNEEKSKLEKSFSDSDDEPLATKVPVKAAEKEIKEEPLQIITEITPVTMPKSGSGPAKEEKLPVSPKRTPPSMPVRPIDDRAFVKSPMSPKHPPKPHVMPAALPVPPTTITATPVSPPSVPAVVPFAPFPSPKVNPSFLTPKFDRNFERKLPSETFTSPMRNNLPSPTTLPKLELPKPASPSSSSNNATKKTETDTISAANLMPSKEESSKIFGIASVSLAQSSGPDNTKCTLGKCGSVHKPPLGPVVPTEAYLGEPLSSKERRKAKVNMTHEQIQKWLIECSSNPDEIQDDLDDDYDEPLKPKTFAPTPPLIRDEKDSGSSSKTVKDVRSESTWSGKGPSLKATPVVVKEESSRPSPLLATDLVAKRESPFERSMSPKQPKIVDSSSLKEKTLSPIALKKSETISKIARETNTKSPKPSTSSVTSSPKHPKAQKVAAPATQKKLPAPKRQPVYSTKPAAVDAAAKKKPSNSFAAFSPENETSVYSFDKEDDVPPPVAKPFRRHSRRESNADENTSSEKHSKAKDAQQNSISVTLTPEENNKPVKVSLDGADLKKSEKPTETPVVAPAPTAAVAAAAPAPVADSDSESHTFYIPLQGTGTAAASSGKSDMIQGVAVKLGREGPEGPNQRVIMHATLVTKAQMGSNTTPIPESMNVHEIVKSLLSTTAATTMTTTAAVAATIANKDISTTLKSVPVGTVQPRFKSSPELMQNASGSGLARVNSNSSLLSGSTKSKTAASLPPPLAPVQPKKPKDVPPIKMFNNTAFPRRDDPAQMVEAPIFRPTEKEFHDPMEFIERITPIAARFGICKIIPPDSFKPECRVSDDMRFTAYNQYVHKMLHRWGPSAKEFSAIKKYLATQSIAMTHPPWIGGMEVDLPRLYHTVQELGGLKEVIEKKKWTRVAEEMCIPKLAQDRVTKLDDIYCKYLLPYDTLSPAERQKLFDEVEADWAKREARARRNADRCVNLESISNEDGESSGDSGDESDDEVDGVSMECIVKGRNMPLNAFFRIARNTMALWFKNTEPTVTDIEAEFWRHVAVRDSHVCVHSGSIDSSGWGYGFPTPGPKTKGSTCAKHPWNLKVLTNNTGSVLRSLGSVIGVTVPTLHVGMLFSACCWYRDPHGLSWIEYLHTGASKIWYGIPDEQSSNFRTALTALIPTHCQNKTIWLPCDTVMVPPHMLTDRGVSLCRVEQKPGEFVVIFPRAYTSSVATGYVVSESVYFATSSWLDSARDDFRDIHESCEPAMFSLEQLLFAIGGDQRVLADILTQTLPMLVEVYDKEVAARQQLKASGLTQTEKFQPIVTKAKQKQQVTEEQECDLCRANLYISMVKTTDGNIYCLQHALRNINNGNIQAKQCTLIFTYDIDDIENLIKKVKERLNQLQKKGPSNVSTSKKSK